MSIDVNTHPVLSGIRKQRTFCIIKPDGVMRGLSGEIIRRIELSGLKIVALKMINASRDQIIKHYPMSDQAWVDRLGEKGLGSFNDLNLDAEELLGTNNKSDIGRDVAQSLIDYMTSGPIICLIVEGIQAIDMVRKLAGHTLPFKAEMGTIRGDFSNDAPPIANAQKRAIHNLFHASENKIEAEHEINLWFTPDEISSYSRTGEDVMYSKTY